MQYMVWGDHATGKEGAGHRVGGEGIPHLGNAGPSQCWRVTGPSASQRSARDLAAPSAGATARAAEAEDEGRCWGRRVGGMSRTEHLRNKIHMASGSRRVFFLFSFF